MYFCLAAFWHSWRFNKTKNQNKKHNHKNFCPGSFTRVEFNQRPPLSSSQSERTPTPVVLDSDSQNSDEIIGLNNIVATLNPETSANEIQSANEPRSNNDDTAIDAVIKG